MSPPIQPPRPPDRRTYAVTALAVPALVNYGHFTAMQVRSRRVRGLALHLGPVDKELMETVAQVYDSVPWDPI